MIRFEGASSTGASRAATTAARDWATNEKNSQSVGDESSLSFALTSGSTTAAAATKSGTNYGSYAKLSDSSRQQQQDLLPVVVTAVGRPSLSSAESKVAHPAIAMSLTASDGVVAGAAVAAGTSSRFAASGQIRDVVPDTFPMQKDGDLDSGGDGGGVLSLPLVGGTFINSSSTLRARRAWGQTVDALGDILLDKDAVKSDLQNDTTEATSLFKKQD
jgi:hypothetical protein